MSTNKRSAEAIRLLEKELGIKTSYALAKMLNMPVTSVDRYKKGAVSIGLEKLDEFADKLGLELEIKINKKN